MFTRTILTLMLVVLLTAAALAGDHPSSVEDKMSGLQSMCAESADARADRHARESLYDRLGGYDKILELTREIVRRHNENPEIQAMFAHVDGERLARHVADFMAAGVGGTAEYTGRSLPASPGHLNLTDADFLSAGGDIIGAMKHLGYGQEEIDEVVCILVSLKDQVVFK
jgi:hemoglobin